jgi:flagellar biosynthesis protein
MSKSSHRRSQNKAVALQYGAGDEAPVVVASGMGYLAEKIINVATENGVPVYEDNSLSTILSRLELGQEIPPELYQAVVEIYVYFLHFDPDKRDKPSARKKKAEEQQQEQQEQQEQQNQSEQAEQQEQPEQQEKEEEVPNENNGEQ